ncbi:MAG: ribosomal protein L7/L12 [Polyangiales bacterium]
MALVEARCPTCSAPLDALPHSAPIKCRYCGASLHEPKPTAPGQTRTVFAVSMERVGPSNRARIAQILESVARLTATDAERLVDAAPCELVVVEESILAHALKDALVEGGVGARIERREIALPAPVVLPDRAVLLEHVGADKVAVMKVLRAHVDLGIAEAKRIVERAPCVLIESLEGSRAAAFVAALTEAGASARLQ